MAWRGLRARWITVTTTFLALALGVALITAMGQVLAGTLSAPGRAPSRYAEAPVVVVATGELSVPVPGGSAARDLADSPGLSPAQLDALAQAGPLTLDHVFPAGGLGGPLTGRSLATAGASGAAPLTGRAPAADGEVLLAAPGTAAGARITLYGPDGTAGEYLVAGTAAPVGGEPTVFFTPAEAARLSPRVDVALAAAPVTVPGTRVLTGDARRVLDPATARDEEALISVNALTGTAGGVAAFVSVFVVASTFAFAVARRRGEFALLRAAGATPRQVRRVVLTEALLLGVLGSAAGCVLGDAGAPELAARLRGAGLAPDWFTVGGSTAPALIAFATGVLVALTGAWTAARRAGRVRPAEALREAETEKRGITPVRLLAGLAALAGAVWMTAEPLATAPAELLKRKQYTPLAMLLLIALAALAPLIVPPIARLVTWPLTRLRGATGMLARASALGAPARTAATAAPVVLTVGLAVCLMGATGTVDEARAAERADRVAADFAALPGDAPAVAPDVAAALAAVPGARTLTVRETSVYDLEEDTVLLRRQARAIDGDPTGLLSLPLVDGDPAALDDTGIVVDTEWGRRVGETVRVHRADGSPVDLRVVAVIREGAGGNGAYVTAVHAPGAPIAEVLVDAPSADAVRAAVANTGARLLTRAEWRERALTGATSEVRLVAIGLVVGLALLYTGLFLVGTLAMATRERHAELRLLRLAGAGRAHVLAYLAAETGLVVLTGCVLAAVAGAVSLGGQWLALRGLTGDAAIAVPWPTVGLIAAGCAVLALGTVLTVALASRTREEAAA
ncbi:hypothetical protein Afil01_00980 [Actinorhabdospora filicis]|uniref:ABC3 transporter permease C-terminal domain-containing protein n=2 Tax=Actinorhabdospora filicis TaxID=1785913 RepID=A0A9W6W7A2_9ACTN|nr:hypothetical protein Afil01_00980 [Actinorhabdospora filicis]